MVVIKQYIQVMNLSKIEEKILDFWRREEIFEETLKRSAGHRQFVFYEGPPTANGRPGIHHVLARAFKDVIPRYKTMQGYHVERKAGWDTHGLPVELEVEKTLGLKNKKEIEDYGIAKFNQKCKESVWRYKEEWEKMTERIGYWIDLEHPYITYDNDYIESLWNIIKTAHKNKLLYKGHRVIPQCPRCGTGLSSHEVAQGYKKIEEESVYIRFKIKKGQKIGNFIADDETYILAWTTTPWTLPGNVALAINKNIKYSILDIKTAINRGIKGGELFIKMGRYIIASGLADRVINVEGNYFSKNDIIKEIEGKDLVGLEYESLFEGIIKKSDLNYDNAFKVYAADFVSTEDGTGVVHTAVMYGQDDYDLGEKIGLPKVHTVDLYGNFNDLVPKWRGKFVKDVEKEIIDDLKTRGILYKTEKYAHDYPFCWRCDSPLLYYAKDSWYFKISDLKKGLIKNNEKINWIPEHIKEGRFGEWLREVKDWAISRERYWGTPIPVWICGKCGEMKVIGSREELGVKKDFDLHRPFVDEIKLKCDKCSGEMKRIPEVMDCWFDSGSMPFAQYHYPFENEKLIDKGKQYPADFICEAMDQTRGWFYTLLAVSTLLDKGISYKNVICLGLILDKNGQKMSKHIGNVVDPWQMIGKYGADVLRWYFYTLNQPGEEKRFNEDGLKETSRIFITLLNVLAFYKMFEGGEAGGTKEKDLENILDRWVISKLNLLVQNTTEKLDKYDITTACRKIEDFVDELSVWYIRRSRDRFKNNDEKAKNVLRFVLSELIKLIAPFAPFVAEYIYQELGNKNSVHLCDWPEVNKKLIDEKLEQEMEQVRNICSLALQKRAEAGIKVRQPLAELKIKLKKGFIDKELIELIKDEVNVKGVAFDIKIEEEVILDTQITPKLEEEGKVREFVRQIQAMRKEAGLTPKDKINVYFSDGKMRKLIEKNKEKIKKQVIAENIIFQEGGLKIDKI